MDRNQQARERYAQMTYEQRLAKRARQAAWKLNRRIEFFADKSCVTCDSTDRLELDHVNPAEKIDHRIWSWSQERREAEIAKCQVLCYTCHKAKSKAQAKEARGARKR